MLTHLQDLGQEKFRTIVGLLKQGTPPNLIVHWIQDEWGDCCDLPPDTLAQELEGLHTALTDSSAIPEHSTAQDNARMKLLQNPGQSCLERLVELALVQEHRIEAQLRKEDSTGRPFPETDMMMDSYAKLLLAIQGLKFDLGIEIYMRRMPQDIKQALERQEREEQEVQRQVYEAYGAAEEVFERLRARRDLKIGVANSCSDADPPLQN